MNDHPKSPPVAAPPAAPPAAGPPASAEARFQSGSVRLFRARGIDVFLHWSWFFFALLRLQSTRPDDPLDYVHYQSQAWYAAEYLALFGIVLLHEFGHALACRSVGGVANRIVLWPLGGIAFVQPPPRPLAVFWSVAAGPLVNALLVGPIFGLWLACRAAGLDATAPDLCRFALALAWINGYLLVFNVLPLYPLDGGQMLQALLWPLLGRARSVLAAAVVGVVTALTMLGVAIVERSLVWGILAGFGLLFCLAGIQGARALMRMLAAPRREEVACPACGARPPRGTFWTCPRCWARLDAFATGGTCPNCSAPLATVLCPACGQFRPYADWYPDATPPAPPDAVLAPAGVGPATTPTTVAQRLVWGAIVALLALALCGLPNVDEQPLGLVVWTAGGAALGAAWAGGLTRTWRHGQARRKLRGRWRLVAKDGRDLPDGDVQARQLVLHVPLYEEHTGGERQERGTCWIDPLAEPPAISFTPKAGPDAGQPRPGIYRLDGPTLTVCRAAPGHARPTAFLSQPDVQQVCVYRRAGRGGT